MALFENPQTFQTAIHLPFFSAQIPKVRGIDFHAHLSG
jgi:hypothetical protein